MNNKTDLRISAKNIRKTLPICEISEKLTYLVRSHDFYREAENVMLFYPTKYEINLLGLLEDDKKFYLPKVDGENLLVCPYCAGIKCEKSTFNIMEPCSNPVGAQVLDLVIVPALMADKKGYRLGYGGGFYDRFLSAGCGSFKTLTVIPKELYVEELPVDRFDCRIDDIIYV